MIKLFMTCPHEWGVVQDVTTKSKAELHGETTGNVPQAQNSYHLDQLYNRKHITILQCKGCGKLKRYVEVI